MKKWAILLAFIFLTLSFSFMLSAQENETNSTADISFIDETAELSESEGITPDSNFYFIDGFFDRFGDDIKVREEKIAEIRAMIKEGKIENAREALEKYKEYADKLEEEVNPDKKEEAKRSAAAIYNALRGIESELSGENKKEFFDDIIEKEGKIVTAAEIAGRIKELCETLAKIDPNEYSRVCRTDGNSPEWHKNLDRELTEGQRQEAKLFGDIMSECFRTAGQQCRCDEIPFRDFAETCEIAAPLATACEINKDEKACEQMDDLEMPELPEHLQDIMDDLEDDVSGSRIDLHMPGECREAGATSPDECRRIMIETNAPEECRAALLAAEVKNEREGREICEKIMFELNAPEECIEKGLKDPKECGKLMFQLNAPQECIDAGITGENRNDPKECEKIMREKGPGDERGRGPEFNVDCRKIQNPEERLKCYDGALSGAEFGRNFEERRGEGDFQWPPPCREANTLTRESCEQTMRKWGESQRQERFEPQQQMPPQEFIPPEGMTPPPEFNEPTEPAPTETTTPPSDGTTTSGTDATINTDSGSDGTTTTTDTNTAPTGAAVSNEKFNGNSFLKYFFMIKTYNN
ncbi:hypothetical protein HY449_00060 [Candidatus Pacearchaeota archaeon]|nr:hypothetical protein [Candidatus Pacearchaeota archaeon]